MKILVDADACPGVVKEILYRAAARAQTELVLFANQPLRTPPSPFIRSVQVARGFDVADNEIAARAEPGDLVITADIPLAAQVIEKRCYALDPRGELYTADNVRERLNMRDFLDTLRASGIRTGGPAQLSLADRQRFANQLDSLIARLARK
jgi:uncharacterized protein YaiI (UPF0178 family)